MLLTKTNSLDSLKSISGEAGRQKNGKLWSNLKDICDLLQIPCSPASSVAKEETLFQHMQFKTGQRIHMIGQPFEMLYIVNSGFLKTVLIDELGTEQILSFPMKSDLLGVDGIYSKYYSSETVALSACDLILVPFKKLLGLIRTHPELESAMFGVLSQELIREQSIISMLGSLSAEGRVARFLVSLSDRFAKMGYSNRVFNLRMTRHEIGNYIGLTLETVSRTLSALHDAGLIHVNQKTIEIKDIQALRQLRRLPNTKSKNKINQVATEKNVPFSTLPNAIPKKNHYERVQQPNH